MGAELIVYQCSKCRKVSGWFKHLADKSDGQCMSCAFISVTGNKKAGKSGIVWIGETSGKLVTFRRRVTQPASVVASVTCEICGSAMKKRSGSKTCSPKCRKALSRKQKSEFK